MYIQYSLGAIFIIFILCVHCVNGANDNENREFYVPSAPQNLSNNIVTSTDIHLTWAPPSTFTHHTPPPEKKQPKSDDLSVVPKIEHQSDEPNDVLISNDQRELADKAFWYTSENQKYNDGYSSSDMMSDTFERKRDRRSHRHRKRRQDSEDRGFEAGQMEVNQVLESSNTPSVVKKSVPIKSHKNTTQIAYVLYYEQGVSRSDVPTIVEVQTSQDVKRNNVFSSDLGMEESSTKNLTLVNTSGKSTKVVGFRLRNLRPFTPYKIWVRAFYNFPLEGVSSSDLLERLSNNSDPLYVLTDVVPPSPPKILNLTCDITKRTLNLQWRQPTEYNNSLDQYVVTLRKIPEVQPRTRLTLPTSKNDIETTISVGVELWNVTRYEVKIYAVTKSVARAHMLINGSESPPEEMSSEWCAAHSEAMSPGAAGVSPGGVHTAALLAIAPIALLAAVGVALVYWRCRSRLSKCVSAVYNYLEEGGERAARAPLNAYKKPVVSCSPLRSCASGSGGASGGASPARPPRMAGPHHPAVPATDFPAHVAALHADGDIGFSKEYEIVVARSAALGHTSHHSHRPENRLKNRYLNITAYDHSRVCVSSGGRCGAAGCVGAAAAARAGCDYVNANFIDGMLPSLQPHALRRIRRRLERLRRPQRQPSTKPVKPPPNLAEGIESAFLNIEFSGIVESDEQNDDSDSDRSDDDCELDDVYVDIDGAPTRVKLEWLVWRRRYIATQGPTPATLDAFWRMIWQHRVHTIVMITNLVERGRRKCDMYWPGGGRGSAAEFGGVHVTLLHEDVRAAYTVRHMRVRAHLPNADKNSETGSGSSDGNSWRAVAQYHYTVWPDHGTPRHPLAVLPFVRAAAADQGTVLVHCSAGVGRTGTYIVLDAQLNQLQLTGTLSPLGFLCRARTQRNHLVQTEEQYVFVHDALLEHVRSGNTEVEFPKAREYLVKLLQPITEDELAVLDLNSTKQKSMEDLTNGIENGDTSSIKSNQAECSEKDLADNGSQVSSRTVDLTSEQSKSQSSVRDAAEGEEPKEVMTNGDESEGVYDLAPRSTDTYSKKMMAYNNMTDQEKEEIRRANRAENYALLERMRSLANRHHTYQGPPPVNLLEKQFLLITRSCVEPSVCARAPHNAEKNRPGGILPSDSARVMLVPKPGVEGSEYVNASWVCGRRRLREYCVAQHPRPGAPDLWRLLWDHTAQLVLSLADTDDEDEECEVFWPTEDEKELFVANFRASFVSKDTYIAYRKADRKTPVETPVEPDTNGYRRQESDCADDERLIPENGSPVTDTEPAYRFDRTELRLERLSTGNRDLSARKSIANGDLFSSLSESKKNGPKSPRSPSKMSLKNFKLSSPTKFKFPDWGSRAAGSPPDTAPPPPPVAPSLTVEEEAELRRPCYTFEKVDRIPENVPSDRVIEVTNVSVHSLQDDYQLSVKFIKCSRWLEGDTTEYKAGSPDENEFVRAVKEAASEGEREAAIDRLIQPYRDTFGLVEFVAGCQMEYKNGPVVVVDKYGGSKAMTFCTLSAACGGARDPHAHDPNGEFRPASDDAASLYTHAALGAHARCHAGHAPHTPRALLAAYCALAHYGPLLHARAHRYSSASHQVSR